MTTAASAHDMTHIALEQEERIFGPPGTGKTTTLTKIIGELTKEHGPDSVLVASFTRAAAAELVGRNPVNSDAVKTLHAFGLAALGGGKKIAEKNIGLWNRESPEYQMTVQEGSADEDVMDGPKGGGQKADEIFSMLSILRNKMMPESQWPQEVRKFYARWEAWKRSHDIIDFGDMIELPLKERIPVPGNPKFGIFDEAQDFTKAEITLARYWGQSMERAIFALDDDQAIYYFKGTDPEACLDPRLPVERVTVLPQSYRVPAAVHRYAEAWIKGLTRREPKVYNPRDYEGSVRFLARPYGSWTSPDRFIDDAMKYVDQGKSVMFLTTCSYMLGPLKTKLRLAGIPFHNPYRAKRPDWNPLTPQSGVAASQRLLDYLRTSPEVHGVSARMWNIEEFWRWTDALNTTGVLKRGAKKEIEGYLASLGNDRDQLASEIELPLLMEWMDEDALAHAIEADLGWYREHLQKARIDAMHFPLEIIQRHGAKTLMERPKVVIGTVHSVKGGQADVVYLFPDVSEKAWDTAQNGGTNANWLASMANDTRHEYVANEKRLYNDTMRRVFYVGMTRARDTLVICPPARSGRHWNLPNPGLW